jgi:hypothetical protein
MVVFKIGHLFGVKPCGAKRIVSDREKVCFIPYLSYGRDTKGVEPKGSTEVGFADPA